jgi:enoyl-CoA hydratase/carnithine racemase
VKTINWKIEEGIGRLVMDQPPANTMTRQFFDELYDLTHKIIPGSGIRAMIIYGSGRHFSSGADHKDLTDRIMENLPEGYPETLPGFLQQNTESLEYIDRMEAPTFAAIRGSCFGSALELALACKFRVCGEGSVLGFPESSFGLMPGCGGSVRLPGITGRAKAIELILGGRNFSAEEALHWGIVHKIVARKDVIAETLNLAVKLTQEHGKS